MQEKDVGGTTNTLERKAKPLKAELKERPRRRATKNMEGNEESKRGHKKNLIFSPHTLKSSQLSHSSDRSSLRRPNR